MWQLAIAHLGRTPTRAEAVNIQFPVIRRLRDFPGHRFLRYVGQADIERLKPFQPYKRLNKGQLHPFPKLVALSNTDKHRKLHLLVTVPHQATLTNQPNAFRDCIPVLCAGSGGMAAVIEHIVPKRSPHADDMVFRVLAQPTGPNPEVDLTVRLTCFVSTGRLGPVVPMLEDIAQYVTAVLRALDSHTDRTLFSDIRFDNNAVRWGNDHETRGAGRCRRALRRRPEDFRQGLLREANGSIPGTTRRSAVPCI
jgi:hypothetical protein